MNKIQKEIFEMEQELGVPSHLRWHNSKYTALLEQVGTNQECDGDVLTCLNEKCLPNQETLEEAHLNKLIDEANKEFTLDRKLAKEVAIKFAKWQQEHYTIEEQHVGHTINELDKEYIKGFNEGSAYQQERSYSEEKVRNIANWAFGFYRRNDLSDSELEDEFNRILEEQFKNK